MPPDRLTGARDLCITPRVHRILRDLDKEAKPRMLDELLDAIAKARESEDLRPINDVIEAWYRSVLVFAEGGEAVIEELQEGLRQIIEGEPGMTLDEVRERLHLDAKDRPSHP
jgi:hypothetical protein